MINELLKVSTGDPAKPPLPDLSFPVKLAVVGQPFSGKTTLAQQVSGEQGLALIDPVALVTAAVAAADDFVPPAPPPDAQVIDSLTCPPEQTASSSATLWIAMRGNAREEEPWKSVGCFPPGKGWRSRVHDERATPPSQTFR